jgi:hypothetical protein
VVVVAESRRPHYCDGPHDPILDGILTRIMLCPFRKHPSSGRLNNVIGRESRCGRRELTPHAALIAAPDPLMLLVGAGHQPGQPAPLSLNPLGVPIGHSPSPVHRAEHADDGGDQPPELDHQGDDDQQGDQLTGA